MKCYLLVDFGSTNTKITVVDIENAEIVLTSKAITTIEDDIMIGFNKAYEKIEKQVIAKEIEFVDKLGCSSAAGGLKMIAIGLVPELTSEAAKRASLGAGAKILATYSYELDDDDVLEMLALKPEIILLSGGTDGGNKETIIKNAKTLARFDIKVPIIVACNKNAQPEVARIFDEVNFDYHRSQNVMPSINVLNVDNVRDIIREVFMKNIVYAKGLDKAIEYVGDVLMPTPAAVLNAAQLLSKGTETEDGLGDLVVIDIGGATTDVHSLCSGYPSKGGVTMKGLAEPFAKRSVEGDLGMRYSVQSCYQAAGYRNFSKNYPGEITIEQVEQAIQLRHDDIEFEPQTKEAKLFDETIARVCCALAMQRHAGYIETSFSPFGTMFAQYGKDLTAVRYLIGTGGVLVHNEHPVAILQAAKFDDEMPDSLRPMKPEYLLDKTYILSAMGLLSTRDENLALKIMKKYLKKEVQEEM
ncbi:glutamate mutase L [Erysipelotrichaceae bacterium OttesenSCG-928-M19]|nr:glutamate mutase L [Erysipelotrichaceae bacterium OttesenSCG-928-M19]